MKIDAMSSLEKNGADLITSPDGAQVVAQTVSNILGLNPKSTGIPANNFLSGDGMGSRLMYPFVSIDSEQLFLYKIFL